MSVSSDASTAEAAAGLGWRLKAAMVAAPLLSAVLLGVLVLERGGVSASGDAAPTTLSTVLLPGWSLAVPGWLAPALALATLLAGLWLVREALARRAADAARRDGSSRHRQQAILRLLDEMAPLADGDLRVRATVDESMTGALADAFNDAVSELRRLASSTVESAHAVHAAVEASRRSARSLSAGASVQAREILRSSNYLNAMSGAMSMLSANAAESAAVAGRARSEVGTGREGVGAVTVELSRIRDEARMTRSLMLRLEENARTIDREVARMVDLARRTDLLALNTTLRASGERPLKAVAAGGVQVGARASVESGSGAGGTGDWARLSDEVSELAAALGESSREIADITSIIRDDAVETLRSMSAMEAAFEQGVASADGAAHALGAIEATVSELDVLIGDTATKAVRQSGVVRRLSGNMAVIHRLSRDGAVSIEAAAGALDDLRELAEELERSVAGFRL